MTAKLEAIEWDGILGRGPGKRFMCLPLPRELTENPTFAERAYAICSGCAGDGITLARAEDDDLTEDRGPMWRKLAIEWEDYDGRLGKPGAHYVLIYHLDRENGIEEVKAYGQVFLKE